MVQKGLNPYTRVHRILLACAHKISAPVADAITSVGPVSSRTKHHPSIGHFRARAIIGQQLSANAARSIGTLVAIAARDAKMGVLEVDDFCAEDLRACGAFHEQQPSLAKREDYRS